MERSVVSTRTRHFLMCPPAHFDVVYAINPWMHPEHGADASRAVAEWERLRAAYEQAGHTVNTIAPKHGLPDMVFAANSALVLEGTAVLARFRYPQRTGEERAYARWFRAHGFAVRRTEHVHEGEGDFACAGDVILGGYGFRTDPGAHREIEAIVAREIVSLELVDPRFYHLDTALLVLDDEHVAYYPGAFAPAAQAELQRRYPDAVIVSEPDAIGFGCNATSDGTHVFLPAGADALAIDLEARGFTPIPIALPELRKAGGSVKCCTLELRSPGGAS